jgi:ribosomal protein L37AE/L43A
MTTVATVTCRTEGCPSAGVVQRLVLRLVAITLVEVPRLRCRQCLREPVMEVPVSLLRCEDCTTLYSVGAQACPQCGSSRAHGSHEEDDEMAKITVHGGPTNSRDLPPAARQVAPVDTPEPAAEPEPINDDSAAAVDAVDPVQPKKRTRKAA